jgi:hypothetical protein
MTEEKECFVCYRKIEVNTEDGRYHDQYDVCPDCEKEVQKQLDEYYDEIK